ncbi:hypothetical protein A0H81_13277 [Grifola frondosa]|uniref:Uncharacterized protein n=1 Tax=Grifola frondosa TaxID=5627 RepID=A0A1C7LVU9_GRIFR|nr:hypothetical protein A0H81_13277 [Grifola frondosa]
MTIPKLRFEEHHAHDALTALDGDVQAWNRRTYFVSTPKWMPSLRIDVEFFGHTACGFVTMEGQNALDAAVLAYTNVKRLDANIIPDYAKMICGLLPVSKSGCCDWVSSGTLSDEFASVFTNKHGSITTLWYLKCVNGFRKCDICSPSATPFMALAIVGVRVLADDEFFTQVEETFREDCRVREQEAIRFA